MTNIQQILENLQQGDTYAYSYTSRAAEAHFNISINYLKDKGLYNVYTQERPAYSDEIEYSKEVAEAEAVKYIEANLARNESKDANANPSAKRPK